MIINDGLQSLVTSQGDPLRDKAAATYFVDRQLNDYQLMAAYSTWAAKRLVNIPAKDALRNWRIWQAEPEQINALETAESKLGLQVKLLKCLKLARAMGGAAIYIGTGDTDPSKPLDPSRIKMGGIRYLTVLPRTDIVAGELSDDVTSEYYNTPAYYQVLTNNAMLNIHPSRLVVMIGEEHADPRNVMNGKRGWGESIIQSSYDELRNSASANNNVATLMFEATINVVSIPDLFSKLDDGFEQELIQKRLMLAAAQKGLTGDYVKDSQEEFERHSASFSNLDKLMTEFAKMVGATQGIPASKFLGQSASGLNSTGEHELKNYYDDIKTMQALEIQPALRILDECLIRSALGDRPSEISYLWSPLSQPTAKEIAETGEKIANTISTLASTGLYEREALAGAGANQLVNTDALPTLGDEITKADMAIDELMSRGNGDNLDEL